MKTSVDIPVSTPWSLHSFRTTNTTDGQWHCESGTSTEQRAFDFLRIRHRFRHWVRLTDLQDLVRRWRLSPEGSPLKAEFHSEIIRTVALESPLGERETQALFDERAERNFEQFYASPRGRVHKKFSGRKRRGTSMFRHPRTFQGRKMALIADPDDVPPRAKQRKLPSTWDDLVRGDLNYRSWKHYRKTSWKIVD